MNKPKIVELFLGIADLVAPFFHHNLPLNIILNKIRYQK